MQGYLRVRDLQKYEDLPHGIAQDDEHNESEWQATSAIKNSPDYVTEAK
jgi:hypothetical protein